MTALYADTIVSKSGKAVPLYRSGKAAHSKYDPEREASLFPQTEGSSSFVLIAGIAGGYHIKSFLQKNPEAAVLAVERTKDDIDFLKRNVPCVAELFADKRIFFCGTEGGGLEQALLARYFPARHGGLQILCLRSWAEENAALFGQIAERAKGAAREKAADYSTQARFGRLWPKNIFCSLKALKALEARGGDDIVLSQKELSKTAAVIAAGPSLDWTAQKIESEREKYFVIATDTAAKAFVRRKIKVDALVSIDAQCVSAGHFNAFCFDDAIFVLDLSANFSTALWAAKNGRKTIFTVSGHPLSVLAGGFCKNPFPRLEAGGGTVAICAADFARQCGFQKIEIFGADFGYSRGKPYARGTYLDDLYRGEESRTGNAETSFVRLMFRSRLEKNGRGVFQNQTLREYQKTMEAFLDKDEWKWNGFVYECQNKNSAREKRFLKNAFDSDSFKSAVNEAAGRLRRSDDFLPEEFLLLPEMAYWRNGSGAPEGESGQNKISAKEAKNLALNDILRYNDLL